MKQTEIAKAVKAATPAADSPADQPGAPTPAPSPAPTEAPPAPTETPAPSPPPEPEVVPQEAVLFCPGCGEQHIDGPEPELGWTDPPHKVHQCHFCRMEWQPMEVETRGVRALGRPSQHAPQPLARATPASGLEQHNLRSVAFEARSKVQALGGDGAADALVAVDKLAILAGLPPTELPR